MCDRQNLINQTVPDLSDGCQTFYYLKPLKQVRTYRTFVILYGAKNYKGKKTKALNYVQLL